jgi:hypothetical protein
MEETDERAAAGPGEEPVPQWFLWCNREVHRQPLAALTAAAAVGFVLGGGLRSRIGRGLIVLAGRSVVRSAVYGFIAGLVEDHGSRHDGATSQGTRPGTR